jgi:hypothetical protein
MKTSMTIALAAAAMMLGAGVASAADSYAKPAQTTAHATKHKHASSKTTKKHVASKKSHKHASSKKPAKAG